MTHYIHSYPGNKLREMKTVFPLIEPLFKDKTIIIEPFCGSQAISYYISTKLPNKFKYILNDCDLHIKEIYNLLLNKETWETVEDGYNDTIKTILESEDPKTLYKSIIKQKDIVSYLIYRRYYAKFLGLFPSDRKNCNKTLDLSTVKISDFYRNEDIDMINGDAIVVLEKYKDNADAIIILDPPYLDTCNSDYQYKSCNIYEYLYRNPISEWQCKVILILEDNWIIRLLFAKCNILSEYGKQYSVSKKRTRHIVITN